MNLRPQNVQQHLQKPSRVLPGVLTGCAACLFAVVCGLPLCASAADASGAKILLPLSFTARGSSVLSDLDGDHQADLATIEPDALIQGGYRYRIDVSLTGQRPSTLYVDASVFKGLRILARDVDGDDDLDLVVTSRFQELIGIWVNDGRGQFTRQPVAAQSPLSGLGGFYFETLDRSVRPAVLAGSSTGLSNRPRSVFCVGPEFSTLSGFRSAPRIACLNPGSSLRAPPLC